MTHLKRETVVKPMFREEELARIIANLAEQIDADYAGDGAPLVLVGVLKSAIHFFSDISRKIKTPHVLDLVQAKSYYDGTESCGTVTITREPEIDLEGKRVLVIEDIYDSGRTLRKVMDYLEGFGPASLEACCLFSKPEAHVEHIDVRYTGAQIANQFIVGYGLDHDEKYRDLPFVGVLGEG